jgi:divalent metal cation (Fe/Co/Zn/Cd) transporter
VDIQVRVDGDLSVRAGHDIAHAVKDALLASVSHAITDVSVHVEPYPPPSGGKLPATSSNLR